MNHYNACNIVILQYYNVTALYASLRKSQRKARSFGPQIVMSDNVSNMCVCVVYQYSIWLSNPINRQLNPYSSTTGTRSSIRSAERRRYNDLQTIIPECRDIPMVLRLRSPLIYRYEKSLDDYHKRYCTDVSIEASIPRKNSKS